MSGWLVVFAKQPRPGRVKTRMTPPLTPEQAAALYARMLDDVLAVSADAAQELGLRPLLAVDPPEACAALARRAPAVFSILAQRGADLAERMQHLVRQAGAAGGLPLLLRGSDSPALGADTLAAARRALDAHDLVLCPDRDGGYALVGLRRPAAGLFDHPMSTSRVAEDTLARARARGLRATRLGTGFDLDTGEDLAELGRARARGAELPCPRTLAFLDEQGLWPAARFPGSH